MKIVEGRYTFRNDTHINISNDYVENEHILTHEEVHKKLSMMSTLGLFLIMMDKSIVVDDSKNWLYNKFIDSMNKMNEQIATNIEYISIFIDEGKNSFDKKIKELKENNSYYKYFNDLYELNRIVKTPEGAVRVIDELMKIGIISMNINLDNIPLDEFQNDKDFQRFFSKDDNNIRYNANTRFKILFKQVLINADKNNQESDYRLNLVNEGTYLGGDDKDICSNAISKVYKNSLNIDIIMERISTIDNKKIFYIPNVNSAPLSAYPLFLNKEIELKYEFCELEKIIYMSDNANKNAFIRFEHLMAGLEDISIISFCPHNKNIIYFAYYNIEEISQILDKIKIPIVFVQKKLFKKKENIIIEHCKNKPIYIFIENSLASSLEFIYSEFSGGRYTTLKEEGYSILLLIKKNIVLIQHLIDNAVKELVHVFGEETDIKYINYSESGINAIDEILAISRRTVDYCSYAERNIEKNKTKKSKR